MKAQIMSVGTEVLLGQIVDTNAAYLAQYLSALGIDLYWQATVGDNLGRLTDELRRAWERADLIVMTGGVGPTEDDLTREGIAALLGEQMTADPDLEAHLRAWFGRRGQAMPERNVMQAMFPEASEPLPNPRGTAPGIWCQVPRPTRLSPCRIAAMPGVPSEMKTMFRQQVLRRLDSGERIIRRARINCFGVGESQAEEILGDLTAREREITALVGSGLSNGEIAERLVISTATAKTHVNRAMMKTGARDRAQLVVFAYENGLVRAGRS